MMKLTRYKNIKSKLGTENDSLKNDDNNADKNNEGNRIRYASGSSTIGQIDMIHIDIASLFISIN